MEETDILYRRLSREQVDKNDNQKATSNAFYRGGKPDPSISVEIAKPPPSIEAMKEFATRPDANGNPRVGFGVGVLIVGEVKGLGLDIVPAADEPGSESSAHCLIKPHEGETIEKPKCRELAKKTDVRLPPG